MRVTNAASEMKGCVDIHFVTLADLLKVLIVWARLNSTMMLRK